MYRLWFSTLVVLASITSTPPAAHASDPNTKWVAWQVQEENDALAAFSGSDEFYTQGLRFRIWKNPTQTGRLLDFANGLGTLGGKIYKFKDFQEVVGFEFGQNLFTPESLKPNQLIPDDRPYAGLLYGGLLFNVTEDVPVEDYPIQQLFEFQLGIVGPEAGGEWAQSKFHELIDDEEPMGWDNQLPLEPLINLFYLWRQRRGSNHFDLVPHWGFALGTTQIYLNAGATVRAGWHISDFGPMVNTSTFSSLLGKDRHPWEFYVFIGGDARAIAHNLFLDGTIFNESHSVEKDDFVTDLKAGFSWRFRDKYRFTYTFVRRSQEFSPLPMGGGKANADHDFGSLSFSFEKKL